MGAVHLGQDAAFGSLQVIMRSSTTGIILAACAATSVDAQSMYGIMFRTGGQTSGLNPILYDVNPSTGAATNPRNVNVNVCVGLAIDPASGTMYGLTDQFGRINNQSGQGGKNLLFSINPATGFATGIGRLDPTGVFQEFEGDLAFHPVTGVLWGVSTSQNGAAIFTISTSTGLATQVSSYLAPNIDISALAFDANGNMFALDTRYPTNPGPAILLRIDPATGTALQSWTTTTTLGTCAGMTFGPGGVLYVTDGDTGGTNKLYSFDFGAGTLVAIGPTGAAGGLYAGLAGLAYRAPACPCDLVPDGSVDGLDLGILLAEWGPATPSTRADFNSDGNVDGNDLGLLLAAWGPCPG